ncbi:hypothetical protein ACXYMX_06005 [Sporosarcina sp. CAU 1771]
MKKLFAFGSSVVIDDFSSLRITGPYSLVNLGPNFATIKCDSYLIEAEGEELTVDKLKEEIAVFHFESIKRIEISLGEKTEDLYDS